MDILTRSIDQCEKLSSYLALNCLNDLNNLEVQ